MKDFPRLFSYPISPQRAVLALAGACLMTTPALAASGAFAEAGNDGAAASVALREDAPLLGSHSSQGYLGIDYKDIDAERVSADSNAWCEIENMVRLLPTLVELSIREFVTAFRPFFRGTAARNFKRMGGR